MTFLGMPKRENLCIKIISIFVAQAFLLSNIAFAVPQDKPANLSAQKEIIVDPEKIVIPIESGLVKSKFAGNTGRLVIHIQDAHCNFEAQSNIVKILENLYRNYNIDFIAVEGADGPIDTSWFKAFPDDEVRKEVATYFMKKGEITGPEFLSITTDYPIKLFGAETRSYYIENLNAFTSSYPSKEATEKYFNQIKTVLNKLKTYIYSEELKTIDSKMQDYESKKLPFNEYVRFLEDMAGKQKINLRQYEHLFKLISALIYEKKIDFSVTDKERASLIDELSKKLDKDTLTELVTKSLSFKIGKISSVEYYDYLKGLTLKNGIELSKKFPNLYNYIIYNAVYSKIENEKLFNDIKNLEIAIKEKLFKNDDQRTLERLSRHIDTLLGLVNIKLLNGDFEYYKAHKDEFIHDAFLNFIKAKAARYGLAYNIEQPNEAVAASIPKLEDFYSIAIKRDNALVDNTLDAMKKEKLQVSVLVTGGFHSEGITKLLEKQGISYLVVCPSITKDVPSPYIQVLTNQRTPFEDILMGNAADAPAKQGMVVAWRISQLLRLAEDNPKLLADINGQIASVDEKDLETRLQAFEGEAREIGTLLAEAYRTKLFGPPTVSFGKNRDENNENVRQITARIAVAYAVKSGLGLKEALEILKGPDRSGLVKEVTALFKAIEEQRKTTTRQSKGKPDSRTSPGGQSIGPYDRLTDQQHNDYNKILESSFREGTFELRNVIIDGRDVTICIHYGLEDRIFKRNKEIEEYNKTVPPDQQLKFLPTDIEAHPSRGGKRFDHTLYQIQLSGLKFFFLTEDEIATIVRHELMHIDIANGIDKLIEQGVIRKESAIEDIITMFEGALTSVKGIVNPVCFAFIKELRNNLELNQEDFVDTLPGCDTRTTGIRDKFRRLEALRSQSAETMHKLEEELERELESGEIKIENLNAIVEIDSKLELGGRRVKEIFTNILKKGIHNKQIRAYVSDYLAHRAILDYITKSRQMASFEDVGFDIYIFVSTSKREAEFWQRRFEETRGQVLPKNAIILSVYSEGADRWHGQTNNGSASLYALTLADELLLTKYKEQAIARYEKPMTLMDILKAERPVMMMLMAGNAKRMQPLAANNKSAIPLLDTVIVKDAQGRAMRVPITVGEAVARSFGLLAATRGGRLTEVWGDQINLPGMNIDSDQGYAIEIFNTVCPFMTDEEKKYAQQKGVIISPGRSVDRSGRELPDGMLREKPPLEEIAANAREEESGRVADLSLGFNSYRWEILEALLEMYKGELEDKLGYFNIDSELWTPLTFSTAEGYADFLLTKLRDAHRKDLDERKIDRDRYNQLTSQEEEYAFKERKKAWWRRIHAMLDKFRARYGDRYRITTADTNQGVVKRVDYGYLAKTTDWWDFGQIRNYFESLMLALYESSSIDQRRLAWSADRFRRYLGIRNKNDWIQRSSLGATKVENSIVLGCSIPKGNIKNCILINVTAEEINAENAIIIGSTVYKLEAKEGFNIVQNVMAAAAIKLKRGDVLASHVIPGQGQKVFRVNWLIKDKNDINYYDPDNIFEKRGFFGNPMSFLELSNELKRYTREEQEAEREKVLQKARAVINRRLAKDTVIDVVRAIKAGDRKALQGYIEGPYAQYLIQRGILTPAIIKEVIERFNASKPDSHARTNMVYLCNLLLRYENPEIKKLAGKEKVALLKGTLGLGPTIEPDIFKRDSVRAIAEEELPNPVVVASGSALAIMVAKKRGLDISKVVLGLGRESRESGGRIYGAFAEGFLATGANIIDATNGGQELTSTPLMYFASRYLEEGNLSGIVEITASHLKGEWNGLKPTLGPINFTSQEMEEWRELTHQVIDKGYGAVLTEQGIAPAAKAGELRRESILEAYHILLSAALEASEEWGGHLKQVEAKTITLREAIKRIKPRVERYWAEKPLRGMRLAADSGFGSMGPIIAPVLEKLGVELADIGGEADYRKALHDANPNNPDNLKWLIDKVREIHAAFGIGFDVDGDRLGVATANPDQKKNKLRGDDISCILVKSVIEKAQREGIARPIIVFNVLCSDRLKEAIIKAGGIPLECAVGFNKVKAMMAKPYQEYLEYLTTIEGMSQQVAESRLYRIGIREGMTAEMGIEISSHIMFKENFNADDAFFAVIKLLGVLQQEAQRRGETTVSESLIGTMLADIDRELAIEDHHTGEWRTPMIDNNARIEVSSKIKEHYMKMARENPSKYVIRNELDGIKIDFFDKGKHVGFLAVRPSGTSAEMVIAVNSLVNQDYFNWIKNDYFAQMAKYKKEILWEKLEPGQYKEEAKAFVFDGKALPTSIGANAPRETGSKGGAGAIRTGTSGTPAPEGAELAKGILSGYMSGEEAANILFTNYQENQYLPALALVINGVTPNYENLPPKYQQEVEKFYRGVLQRALAAENPEVARGLQVMALNALILSSLISNGMTWARNVEFTTVENEMLPAVGPVKLTYIKKASIPADVGIAPEEGARGVFGRGVEDIKKMGANLLPETNYAGTAQEQGQFLQRLILYGMLHVGRFHTTIFTNNRLPNSIQHMSTGKGHLQGNKLDVKHVTKGMVLQMIVVYDRNGKPVYTLPHLVKEGESTLAIPGAVDYMIPLTETMEFNDFSVEVPPEMVGKYNPWLVEITAKALNKPEAEVTSQDLVAEMAKVKAAFEKVQNAPYAVINYEGIPALVRIDASAAPITEWIKGIPNPWGAVGEKTFVSLSANLPQVQNELLQRLSLATVSVKPEAGPIPVLDITSEAIEDHVKKLRKLHGMAAAGQTFAVEPLLKEYKWGKPIGSETEENPILRNLGATTPAEEVEKAKEFGIAPTARIGENWLGKGRLANKLASAVLSLFGKVVYGPQHLAEHGPISGITEKLLQASTDLSWQIHLGFAEKVTARVKTTVYFGLREDMTEEEFIAAMKEGRTDTLNAVTLKEGQSLIVPAKCPHAYLAETVAREVKDIDVDSPKETYSFYDRGSLSQEERDLISAAVREAKGNVESAITKLPPELQAKINNPNYVRTNKDVLTLPESEVKRIAKAIQEAGYLNKVDVSKYIFAPIQVNAVQGAVTEIMGITEGSVALRYTIPEGASIQADQFSIGSGQPLVSQKGKVEVTTEKGETAVIEEGGQRIVPYSAGQYTLKAVEGPAVVVTSYMPLQAEGYVNAAFEAVRTNRAQIVSNKVHIIIPKNVFMGDGPGSWKYERQWLKRALGDAVQIDQFQHVSELVEIIGKDKQAGINSVVVLTPDELSQIDRDGALKNRLLPILASTRMMTVPKVGVERRGLPFIREIESAGIVLGNTTKEDIDKKTDIARSLKRIMVRLTGNPKIDWNILANLIENKEKNPDPAYFNERIRILLHELLITMPARPYEADKEMKGRRELLWAV